MMPHEAFGPDYCVTIRPQNEALQAHIRDLLCPDGKSMRPELRNEMLTRLHELITRFVTEHDIMHDGYSIRAEYAGMLDLDAMEDDNRMALLLSLSVTVDCKAEDYADLDGIVEGEPFQTEAFAALRAVVVKHLTLAGVSETVYELEVSEDGFGFG